MKNNETNQHRLYYTIGEVADYFNVNESLLRFWEKEFDIINPRKSSKGTRYYSPVDIENIRLIYYLTKSRVKYKDAIAPAQRLCCGTAFG